MKLNYLNVHRDLEKLIELKIKKILSDCVFKVRCSCKHMYNKNKMKSGRMKGSVSDSGSWYNIL